jgi:hypothetical protein
MLDFQLSFSISPTVPASCCVPFKEPFSPPRAENPRSPNSRLLSAFHLDPLLRLTPLVVELHTTARRHAAAGLSEEEMVDRGRVLRWAFKRSRVRRKHKRIVIESLLTYAALRMPLV